MPVHRDASESPTSITSVSGTAVAVRGNDIDTDRIIPARYLKAVTFDGIGEFAFQDVRFDEAGHPTSHPFNNPAHRNASILLVNKNFGCGSSREHAPQALLRWGIKAIIGESFAEIFAGNCNALGIPAVSAERADIDYLMSLSEDRPEVRFSLDLIAGTVEADGTSYRVSMPQTYFQALIGGMWDSTALLLQNGDAIRVTASALPYMSEFASD